MRILTLILSFSLLACTNGDRVSITSDTLSTISHVSSAPGCGSKYYAILEKKGPLNCGLIACTSNKQAPIQIPLNLLPSTEALVGTEVIVEVMEQDNFGLCTPDRVMTNIRAK